MIVKWKPLVEHSHVALHEVLCLQSYKRFQFFSDHWSCLSVDQSDSGAQEASNLANFERLLLLIIFIVVEVIFILAVRTLDGCPLDMLTILN